MNRIFITQFIKDKFIHVWKACLEFSVPLLCYVWRKGLEAVKLCMRKPCICIILDPMEEVSETAPHNSIQVGLGVGRYPLSLTLAIATVYNSGVQPIACGPEPVIGPGIQHRGSLASSLAKHVPLLTTDLLHSSLPLSLPTSLSSLWHWQLSPSAFLPTHLSYWRGEMGYGAARSQARSPLLLNVEIHWSVLFPWGRFGLCFSPVPQTPRWDKDFIHPWYSALKYT